MHYLWHFCPIEHGLQLPGFSINSFLQREFKSRLNVHTKLLRRKHLIWSLQIDHVAAVAITVWLLSPNTPKQMHLLTSPYCLSGNLTSFDRWAICTSSIVNLSKRSSFHKQSLWTQLHICVHSSMAFESSLAHHSESAIESRTFVIAGAPDLWCGSHCLCNVMCELNVCGQRRLVSDSAPNNLHRSFFCLPPSKVTIQHDHFCYLDIKDIPAITRLLHHTHESHDSKNPHGRPSKI